MKQKKLTVTVTHVGHPLPKFQGSQAPQITLSIHSKNKMFTFQASPLSMLIQQGDTITVSPAGELNKVNELSEDSLINLNEFDGVIERISHPIWQKNPDTGFNSLYVSITAQEQIFLVKANWNTLLLRKGDEIAIELENYEILKFQNKTLNFEFSAASTQSSHLKGQINRVAHPMMWPNAQGIMGLKTLVLMKDLKFKILPATPESMFLEDGDLVEITSKSIKNARIPQVRFLDGALPEYYEVKYIGHPFPTLFSNGNKSLGRYLITTENEMYLVPADETNMLTQAGDKIINF